MVQNLSLDVLYADGKIEKNEQYESYRRSIQNNMNAIRFSGRLLLNLVKLRVPISHKCDAKQFYSNHTFEAKKLTVMFQLLRFNDII